MRGEGRGELVCAWPVPLCRPAIHTQAGSVGTEGRGPQARFSSPSSRHPRSRQWSWWPVPVPWAQGFRAWQSQAGLLPCCCGCWPPAGPAAEGGPRRPEPGRRAACCLCGRRDKSHRTSEMGPRRQTPRQEMGSKDQPGDQQLCLQSGHKTEDRRVTTVVDTASVSGCSRL